jgi:alcohol dehydrogenase class IV
MKGKNIEMNRFNYYQPTEIIFGIGRINELSEYVLRYGTRCLLVTTPNEDPLKLVFDRVKENLRLAGIETTHFDQVQPNPTTENISAGAQMAREHKIEVIVGVGGGSSMDSAKAIAVEATHEGNSWDYLFFREKQPTHKTLPVIAVSTTSGTGSQVTQVAVVTNTKERNKSAIYNSMIFPKVCIIDPELMLTLPEHLTASTGFDAFCHAFESMLHPNASFFTNCIAVEAIKLVVENLPNLINNLQNLELRSKLALADTLSGLCIANAGVTLPHGVGMAVSGMYPHVMHGESLSIIYPVFSRFTYKTAISQFSTLAQIFNPDLFKDTNDEVAHYACAEIDTFIKKIGMWMSLKDISMPEDEIKALAKASMVLPDYRSNPRVATKKEMESLIHDAYYGTIRESN